MIRTHETIARLGAFDAALAWMGAALQAADDVPFVYDTREAQDEMRAHHLRIAARFQALAIGMASR